MIFDIPEQRFGITKDTEDVAETFHTNVRRAYANRWNQARYMKNSSLLSKESIKINKRLKEKYKNAKNAVEKSKILKEIKTNEKVVSNMIKTETFENKLLPNTPGIEKYYENKEVFITKINQFIKGIISRDAFKMIVEDLYRNFLSCRNKGSCEQYKLILFNVLLDNFEINTNNVMVWLVESLKIDELMNILVKHNEKDVNPILVDEITKLNEEQYKKSEAEFRSLSIEAEDNLKWFNEQKDLPDIVTNGNLHYKKDISEYVNVPMSIEEFHIVEKSKLIEIELSRIEDEKIRNKRGKKAYANLKKNVKKNYKEYIDSGKYNEYVAKVNRSNFQRNVIGNLKDYEMLDIKINSIEPKFVETTYNVISLREVIADVCLEYDYTKDKKYKFRSRNGFHEFVLSDYFGNDHRLELFGNVCNKVGYVFKPFTRDKKLWTSVNIMKFDYKYYIDLNFTDIISKIDELRRRITPFKKRIEYEKIDTNLEPIEAYDFEEDDIETDANGYPIGENGYLLDSNMNETEIEPAL